MSAILSGRAAKAMKSPAYPKFAATVSDQGVPNVVPLLSAKMIDPETMAFVRFMAWKTARNFEGNHKLAFACRGPKGRSYVAQGEFIEWVTQGPLLEQFEQEAMYRYNAYMGANVVGVMKVKEVRDFESGGFWVPMAKKLLSRIPLVGAPFRARPEMSVDANSFAQQNKESVMAPQIMDKWSRALALKFIAIADENGNPLAFSHQGLAAPDPRTLTFPLPKSPSHPLAHLQPGAPIAASVFCPDPVAYQVKGTFAGIETRTGHPLARLLITETFSASPPVPGRRLYPMEGVRSSFEV